MRQSVTSQSINEQSSINHGVQTSRESSTSISFSIYTSGYICFQHDLSRFIFYSSSPSPPMPHRRYSQDLHGMMSVLIENIMHITDHVIREYICVKNVSRHKSMSSISLDSSKTRTTYMHIFTLLEIISPVVQKSLLKRYQGDWKPLTSFRCVPTHTNSCLGEPIFSCTPLPAVL